MIDDLSDTTTEPNSWADIHALWDRSARCGAEADAGRWALRVLEHELGADWVAACWSAGGLPVELAESAGGLRAFSMLIELAAGFDVLRDLPGMGKLKRSFRRNPVEAELAPARAGLRLAAAACHIGMAVEPEAGKPPIDVMLGRGRDAIAVEIKSVFRADLTLAVDSWLHELLWHIHDLVHDSRISLRGDAIEALDEMGTRDLADRLHSAADLVRLGLAAPRVNAGRNWFEVVPVSAEDRPGSHVVMPLGDLWKKLVSRIHRATEQAVKSGATWVVIDSHDDLWTLTTWGREDLGSRADRLASALRGLVGVDTRIHGIIVTDGARLGDLTSADETVRPASGVVAMRRRLDRIRTRQTVVITLSARGALDLQRWEQVLDAEPRWVDAVLQSHGMSLPPSLAIDRARECPP